jgi:hypothetical protein
VASGIQTTQVTPAVPLEPIGAILDAFTTHQVVALGEGNHGNEQGHALRLSLIRDPRFAATVNDIVVEFGSALYQDVMDRFVRGEAVAPAELSQVWRNTTEPTGVWDAPIYEEFFRAVRAVNASLPADRQIRVLLGDPAIDWSSVKTGEDHFRWIAQREIHPVDLIRREILAKKRRGLLIYGDMHFQRKPLRLNFETPPADPRVPQPLISLLEGSTGIKAFTIWTNTSSDLHMLQSDVAGWPVPSLAVLRGTLLGAADFTFYYPFTAARLTLREGKPAQISRDQWRLLPMEEQFDAVLYVGAAGAITRSRPLPALCSETAYIETKLARMALIGMPPSELERVRERCPATAAAQ